MGPKKTAVVDGANIAYIEKSKGGEPKIENILAVRSALEEKGYEPIIIVDATLAYEIDDRPQLEALIDNKSIHQAPAETDADYFIIQTAKETGGIIISNDRFDPFQEDYPWISERQIPVMIVNGVVELYEPKIEELLGPN
jgi:hypothetical protein